MRLGDDIDDHCSRCKRSTDHSVVSMIGEEVLKTRCRTCSNEHKYRQNKSRNKEMTAKEAFDHVLASITGAPPETPDAGKKKPRTNKKS
jgi:recombinational DNA repair protein (RecF pathway)